MAPASLRLDTLAAALVERLEASRRSWIGDEPGAQAAIERIVGEGAEAVARECREVYGDAARARRITEEARQTFLPRYTRLALEQNRLESRPYGVVAGAVLPRLGAAGLGMLFAEIFARRVPDGVGVALFAVPFVAFLWPEIRTAWSRRSYAQELQSLVDDMGRVDAAVSALPEEPAGARSGAPSAAVAEPEPARPPSARAERQ